MTYAHGELTEKIIGEAYYVFNQLGGGYLEKVYENALGHRLRQLPLRVEAAVSNCCAL